MIEPTYPPRPNRCDGESRWQPSSSPPSPCVPRRRIARSPPTRCSVITPSSRVRTCGASQQEKSSPSRSTPTTTRSRLAPRCAFACRRRFTSNAFAPSIRSSATKRCCRLAASATSRPRRTWRPCSWLGASSTTCVRAAPTDAASSSTHRDSRDLLRCAKHRQRISRCPPRSPTTWPRTRRATSPPATNS